MQPDKEKNLEIKQIILGQEVNIKISLEQDNIIQKEDKYYTPLPESAFNFLRTNFYNILSREQNKQNFKYTKSSGGSVFCYCNNSQPHQFSFIFDELLHYFHFGINNSGQIVIHNEDHKTKNLKIIFDNLLSYLANYSDKDYYSYYSQKLEEI